MMAAPTHPFLYIFLNKSRSLYAAFVLSACLKIRHFQDDREGVEQRGAFVDPNRAYAQGRSKTEALLDMLRSEILLVKFGLL